MLLTRLARFAQRVLTGAALGWAVHFAHAGTNDAGTSSSKAAPADGRAGADSKTGSRDVPSRNSAGNFQYSDGVQAPGTDRSGNPGKVHPDGSVSYSDGARASHDSETGDSKQLRPDGQVHLHNRRTGTDQTFPSSTGSGDGKRTDPGKLTGTDKPSGSKQGSGLGPDKPSGSKQGSGSNDGGRNDRGRNDSGKNDKPSSGKNDKPDSGKNDKPDSGKNDKPDTADKPTKGRTVQDDQTGGSTGQVRPSGSDRGGSQDDSSAKGAPRTLSGSTGPGARTGSETSTGNASRLTLPANAPVINPGDTPGGGARTPIVPEGGKR
jgi:hypothetical protein